MKDDLGWKVRKYCRWLRLYMKRVKIVERQIGGCVDAL